MTQKLYRVKVRVVATFEYLLLTDQPETLKQVAEKFAYANQPPDRCFLRSATWISSEEEKEKSK